MPYKIIKRGELTLSYRDVSKQLRDKLGRWVRTVGSASNRPSLSQYKNNYKILKKEILSANPHLKPKQVKSTVRKLFRNYLNTTKIKTNRYVIDEYKKYTKDVKKLQQKLKTGKPLTLLEKILHKKLNNLINKSEKLPHKIITYRGVHLPDNIHSRILKRFEKNKNYKSKGFTSVTPHKRTAEMFAKIPVVRKNKTGKGILLKILAKSGASIGGAEIIHKHGTKYKILGVEPSNVTGYTHIINLEQK